MKWVNFNDKNTELHYYDCVSSIANCQVSSANMGHWQRNVYEHAGTNNTPWFGVPSVAELRNIVELSGWEKGVEKGLQHLDKIKAPKLPSMRRKKTFGMIGSSYDPIRAYSGMVHKAWTTTKRELTENKYNRKGYINLVVDITAAGHVNSEAFFWRGALATVLARVLQESGRRVRFLMCFSIQNHLYGFNRSSEGSDGFIVALQIKDYGEPVEYNSMFATTALAGFFRWYGFKAIMVNEKKLTDGLGNPLRLEVANIEPVLDNNPVFIIENVWTAKEAQEMADKITKQFI